MIFKLFLLPVVALVGGAVISFSNTSPNIENRGSAPTPEPTPFQFQEMTIPFLRNEDFESQLGEMNLYEAKADYTSYLTSYTSEGLKVNGLLTRPNGDMPEGGWPAIVFIHGYIPPASYQTTSNYASYVDYLARNGFVVFKIDLRGHGNSEGEPGGGYYSSDYIYDTLNAYAALQNTDFVNSEKIGLWGHSMAGNVVLRSVAVKQDIPAAVIWAGAVYTYEDMQKYGIDDNSYRPPSQGSEASRRRQMLRDAYGEFSSDSEFWKQVPATNYLDGVETAVQFNHAVDDAVVTVEYSRNVVPILQNASIKVEYNEYPAGGHNINGGAFNEAMRDTIRWYNETL